MTAQAQFLGAFSCSVPVMFMESCVLSVASRGPFAVGGGTALATQRLSTDSIGTLVLTLSGLVTGSAIQIETQAGAVIENRSAASSSEVFNVPAYSPGSASNDLRIKVRKGSAAPFYQPYETQAVSFVGSQSIFVSQTPD